jgi:hypothetical protein
VERERERDLQRQLADQSAHHRQLAAEQVDHYKAKLEELTLRWDGVSIQ